MEINACYAISSKTALLVFHRGKTFVIFFCFFVMDTNQRCNNNFSSTKDIDQLLLHHVLVKITQLESTIERIQENQRSEKKIEELSTAVLSRSSDLDAITSRISVVEDKLLSAFSSQLRVTTLEKEVAHVSENLNQMNMTGLKIIKKSV